MIILTAEDFLDRSDGWWFCVSTWGEELLLEALPPCCHRRRYGAKESWWFRSPREDVSLPFLIETASLRSDHRPSLFFRLGIREAMQHCCRMTLLELEEEWTLGKLRSG